MRVGAFLRHGAVVALSATLVLTGTMPAPAETTAAVQAPSDDAALLLDRVANADEATYRARQLVVYFGKPESAAIVDVSSSSEGRFLRTESGDNGRRVWSRDDVDAVEGQDTSAVARDATPIPMRVQPAAVLAKYEIETERKERMLGVDLTPLTLKRRRDGILVERWWVHEKSGVLYQRALYGDGGKIVGMSTVIDMEWGDTDPAAPPADDEVDAWVHLRPSADAPKRLAHGYRLWQTYELEAGGRPAEQWVYTDGLHALSVFRQTGGLQAPEGFRARSIGGERVWTGAGPGTWAWEGGGRSWLLVAEEPGLDPAEMISPLPRGGRSLWSRMGSMWSRIFRGVVGSSS